MKTLYAFLALLLLVGCATAYRATIGITLHFPAMPKHSPMPKLYPPVHDPAVP